MNGNIRKMKDDDVYAVMLRSDSPNCIVTIDYRQLNWYIREYNRKLWKCVDFWEWLSYELFEDEYHIVGFSEFYGNKNRMEVDYIK